MQAPEQICFYPHFSLVSDNDANLFCDKLLWLLWFVYFDSQFKNALDKDFSCYRLVIVPNYIERILMLIYEISNLRNKGKNKSQIPLRLANGNYCVVLSWKKRERFVQ